MPYTTEGKNAMLDYLASIATYVGLHTGTPSTRRPNELEGGSPGYARLANPWQRASDGLVRPSTQPAFDVPPQTAVRYVGFWSAPSGGVCYAHAQVAEEVFNAQGIYKMKQASLDLNAA